MQSKSWCESIWFTIEAAHFKHFSNSINSEHRATENHEGKNSNNDNNADHDDEKWREKKRETLEIIMMLEVRSSARGYDVIILNGKKWLNEQINGVC